MKRFVLALLVCTSALLAPALAAEVEIPDRVPNTPAVAIHRDVFSGTLSRQDAALYNVYDMFRPGALPDRYKTGVKPSRSGCFTPRILDMLHDWDNLPEAGRIIVPEHLRPRPVRTLEAVPKGTLPLGAVPPAALGKTITADNSAAPGYNRTYATTNFLIHWMSTGPDRLIQNEDNNANGIPDMVEFAGEYLEATWVWMIANDYRLPPDTTDHYYNIYFADGTAEGWLGYTDPIDWPADHSRSYIVLTSDFSGIWRIDGVPIAPADEMRCTASHEFFHAVQFAYDVNEDRWWMEATATWIEDVVGPEWDAVDDYTGWLSVYLWYPEVSLDADWWYGHGYADVIWPVFLQSHLDPDGSIIHDIWEHCEGSTNALSANELVIQDYLPGGFDEAWRDFLVANYTMDYPEAADYPEAYGNLYFVNEHYSYPTGIVTPSSSVLPGGLAANYVRFHPASEGGFDLVLSFRAAVSASSWYGMLISKIGSNFERQDLASGASGGITGFNVFDDEAVLIVSPTLGGYVDFNDYFSWSYSASLTTNDLLGPSPNPATWDTAPRAAGTSSISMVATTAIDPSGPVSYQFVETTGAAGATSSAWQASSSYTDIGLAVNTRYGYYVQARDSSPKKNTTWPSVTTYLYTLCNAPSAPTLYDPAPTKLYISVPVADGNPSYTEYSLYNQTLGNYVQFDGTAGVAPYYDTRAGWSDIRIVGLSSNTFYTFKLKARNGDGVLTDFGPSAAASTLTADVAAPQITSPANIPTWVKEGVDPDVAAVATGDDRATGGSDIVEGEYYFDADPGEDNGTPLEPIDGDFDSPVESVIATIETTGWLIANSPYDVHMRVKDEVGHWSAPVLLEIPVVDGIPPADVTDLAASPKPAGPPLQVVLSVDSASSEAAGHAAAGAVDGTDLTYWATDPQAASTAEVLTLAFDEPSLCSSVTLYPSGRADLFPAKFRVKVGDGTNWSTVVSEYDYAAQAGPNTWSFSPRVASKLCIVIEETPFDSGSASCSAEIAEVQVVKEDGGIHSVDLSWTAPSDVGPTARAAEYLVKFNTSPSAILSFAGQTPEDLAPAPGAAGVPQAMVVNGLEPGTTYYVALKSSDIYDNYSGLSNVASVSTPADASAHVTLEAPADQGSLSLDVPPTFSWHANRLDAFKVQFSNVPSFPSRAFKDAGGRTAKNLQYTIRKGDSDFTASDSQWKAVRKLAASMDGTLYWRVQAASSTDKALGIVHSETFNEYGFSSGAFSNLRMGPYHDKDGVHSVWPNTRPQFIWTVAIPTYGTYFVDFSASPDVNPFDKKSTLTLSTKNYDRTWFRPTASQWKTLKKRFAGVNDGLIYWRVRGFDAEKAYCAASDAQLMRIDHPAFDLRKPSPRRDGTVMPGEVFTLDWNIAAEGYNIFDVQVSALPDFVKGAQTFTLKRVSALDYALTPANVRKLQGILTKAGTDTFYWRVIAIDADKTMFVPSDPQSVKVSVAPAIGS